MDESDELAGLLCRLVEEKRWDEGVENVDTVIDRIYTAAPNREEALRLFGCNHCPTRKNASLPLLLWRAWWTDRTMMLLTAAALASIIVSLIQGSYGWVEGAAIAFAVLMVIAGNAGNEWHRDRQFASLFRRGARFNRVPVQSAWGKAQCGSIISPFEMIPGEDLTVGDVVRLGPGDICPADGIMLSCESSRLLCDESSMTGESDAVAKDKDSPFVISGTRIVDGRARALIVAIGGKSQSGRMLQSMGSGGQGINALTPLQLQLNRLADLIAMTGLVVGGMLLVALLIRTSFFGTWSVDGMLHIAIEVVTVVVVAVPEGLPMAVTVALAYATTQMLRDGNLVRVLAACETMGGATTICTDKTGTLTLNRMTVVQCSNGGDTCDSDVCSCRSEALASMVREAVALNTTAFVDAGHGCFVGSGTECALLDHVFVRGLEGGISLGWREIESLRGKFELLATVPFSSERKYMCTAVRQSDNGAITLHCKGSPEWIMARCSSYVAIVNGEMTLIPMDDSNRRGLVRLLHDWSSGKSDTDQLLPLRTIALAYRPLKDELDPCNQCSEMTLVSLFGMVDPLREEVRGAVDECHRAGIFVRMVTGDATTTACSVARAAGILTSGGLVLEGGMALRRALDSDSTSNGVLSRLQVLSRATPLDKQFLVERLTTAGEIVAVTGDGANDGPALRAAHVSFGMGGPGGTEAAREASTIVLLDDSFGSIVRAVSWGRAIRRAVQRFLQFQLTVNVAAVLIAAVSSIVATQAVLGAVQLLWLNLIMDTFGALALATDPPTPDLLSRPPLPPRAPLLTSGMRFMIAGMALYQCLVVLLVCLWAVYGPGNSGGDGDGMTVYWRTMVFHSFVLMQLCNEVNCRVLGVNWRGNPFAGLKSNPIFLCIWVGSLAVQAVLVQWGGVVFGTEALDPISWAICAGLGLACLPVAFLLRWLGSRVLSEAIIYPTPSDASDVHVSLVHTTRAQMAWHSVYNHVRHGLALHAALRRAVQSKDDQLALVGPGPT